jgi:predicted transposase/invertase (TIGR01784 family)
MSQDKNTTKMKDGLENDNNFIMLPVVDFVFKLLFGDVQHKERLISLLSSVLKLPVGAFAGIEIVNPELPKLFEEDKKGILDIRVKLADGKQVEVEIQILPSSFLPQRTLYYWAKMYTTQIIEGETYNLLEKCITINIVDYEFLPGNKMHNIFHLTEDETGHRLTDVLEVHFCELKKLRNDMEISDADDPALDWMRFIGAKTKGEMEMLADKNEAIKDAFNYLQVISNDEEKRHAYEARQAWLMDQRTREKVAREEGKLEGKLEGILEGEVKGKLYAAKNFLSMGISTADVARATGLPVEELEKLK